MQKISCKITVYFENPFWVCVYERLENKNLSVCKITFSSEPKDYEVYEFLLQNWGNLVFSPAIKAKKMEDRKINPKRMQREISKSFSSVGVGTKAQLAIKAQQEEGKLARKKKSRKKKETEKQLQFETRQRKRKEKKRGKK